jgi:protein-S-isoprenylcysteine O-methyltransferase Ste14
VLIASDGLTDRSRRPYQHANQLPVQIEMLIAAMQAGQATLGRAEDARAAGPALSGCPHPGDPMPAFLSGPGPRPKEVPCGKRSRYWALPSSFAVAPSSVAGLVPWWITRWEIRPPFFDLDATRAVGILVIVAGLPGLVDSFARFALQGLGTPAPIAPTQNLVVTGLYRYVRNPIYVALVAVILGQAVLFGDLRLLGYGVLVWLAFHAFVVGYEEPALVRRFGTEYEDFRANVPRWIPRLTPWRAARRRNHS